MNVHLRMCVTLRAYAECTSIDAVRELFYGEKHLTRLKKLIGAS